MWVGWLVTDRIRRSATNSSVLVTGQVIRNMAGRIVPALGFGTAAGFREQFTRRRGVAPRAYRQMFRAVHPAGDSSVRAVGEQFDRHGAGGGRVRGDQALVEPGLDQPA
jgi:hypothetical protein